MTLSSPASRLQFRDPARARGLLDALGRVARELPEPVTLMHVCGTHEQAIARYGLRSGLPDRIDILMGPGCPVCVTAAPEVDEAVAIARRGVRVATYGDMLRVPGTRSSLADAKAEGAPVVTVYGVEEAVELARERETVFFASGFETTAVATAAALLSDPPPGFSVLSAHKWILPAMELVAAVPQSHIRGFLAAGHAATITGWGQFEPFVARHGLPVVVAGFEPLDILAALLRLAERVRDGEAVVDNLYPRCVTREGNGPALRCLWSVFETAVGTWRGIADIPDGNLRLRPEFADRDARRRYPTDPAALSTEEALAEAASCRCGEIMTGLCSPGDCALFGRRCTPEDPVGACMVSTEGTCRIWFQYGGRLSLGGEA